MRAQHKTTLSFRRSALVCTTAPAKQQPCGHQLNRAPNTGILSSYDNDSHWQCLPAKCVERAKSKYAYVGYATVAYTATGPRDKSRASYGRPVYIEATKTRRGTNLGGIRLPSLRVVHTLGLSADHKKPWPDNRKKAYGRMLANR